MDQSHGSVGMVVVEWFLQNVFLSVHPPGAGCGRSSPGSTNQNAECSVEGHQESGRAAGRVAPRPRLGGWWADRQESDGGI